MRAGLDTLAEVLDLGRAGRRAHQHAVAAGTLGFLDHQLRQVRQYVGQLIRLAALEGRHVLQDRLFIQVEPDHFRHVRVDRLVVRHAGADRIRQHYVARAVRRDQAGHAEHRIGVESLRIEEGIVDAAVDHIHGLGAVGGTHEHLEVVHEQVGAFHQLHAHFPGQECMLEERAVKPARRQHHHIRVVQAAGAFQGLEQQVGIVVHRGDALLGEHLGEQAHHHLAVFEHVAHAAGGTQVVFEHVVGAVAIAHQVDPGDVRIDIAVQVQADHGLLVTLVAQHLIGGNDPGLDDALVVVDVGKEHVQRIHPLDTAALDDTPLTGGDAAGDDIEGDQALGVLLVAIQGEGDPGAVKQQVGFTAALGQQFWRRVGQPAGEFLIMRTANALCVIHFIKERSSHSNYLVSAGTNCALALPL
eukprot:gene9762-biopygen9780